MPTTEQCTEALDRALAWILAHLAEFDPFRGGAPFEVKNGQKIGELAILLSAYVAATGDRESEAPRRFAELLEEVSAHRQFSERLLRSPAEFVLFAEVYAGLRTVGRDHPARRAQLERALAARLLEHNERLPHRMMDIASCLHAGGFSHPWPSLAELYDQSILGRNPSALFLNEDGLYALTHVLMFLYRFGARPAIVPADRREGLGRLLSTLMIVMAQERHWDLLAEVLLCWEAVGYPATEVSGRAWSALLAKQEESGALPGPEWANPLYAAAEELGKVTPEEVRFSHYYHTTLVSIIAIALCRRNLAGARPAVVPAAAPLARQRRIAAPPPPGFAALPDAAQRAGRWLAGLGHALCGEPRVRRDHLYRLLLGLHLAEGAGGGSFEPALRQIAARLAMEDAGGVVGSDRDVPPLLALTAAGILAAHGLPAGDSPDDESFAAATAAALAVVPEVDPVDDLALVDKRAVLASLGLHVPLRGLPADDLLAWAEALPLAPSPAALEELLQRIGSRTALGTRPAGLGADGCWLGDLLGATALRLLRDYDLAAASRVLRALSHLGAMGESWRQGIDFLLLQQRDDGPFGLFAAEEAKLRTARPDFAADTDLSLLTTVECLWTLAEAGDWRLLASLAPEERREARQPLALSSAGSFHG